MQRRLALPAPIESPENLNMDGIHDLGGMAGFGPVTVEANEPVFHEAWEKLAYALNVLGIARLRSYNTDEYRHSIERMDPAHYLSATYYERVLTGVATLLVEKGVVTHNELEARAGAHFPLSRPVAGHPTAALHPQQNPRFAVEDRVVVRNMHPAGHTRVPRYVRGKRGVVVRVAPKFSVPDAAAHGLPHRTEHTYHVEFLASELWSEAGGSNESVVVDLWDCYLERV
jgi:nitrile hydratase beta subunit